MLSFKNKVKPLDNVDDKIIGIVLLLCCYLLLKIHNYFCPLYEGFTVRQLYSKVTH